MTTTLPGFAMINDFGSTENYAVFVQPRVVANTMQFLVSKEPGKTLSVEDGSAVLHLIPRVGSMRQQLSFEIPVEGPTEANLQFCNAYENGNEVIIDAILSDGSVASGTPRPLSWPWGSSLIEYRSTASKKSLWRYTVDTKSGNVSKRLLCQDHCFFGVVNPSVSSQKHRYIYMNVGGLGAEVAPLQGITKFDCEAGETDSWMPESYEFCGEPMYAPRQGDDGGAEDSGYILSVLYNGNSNESELLILQASNIGAGPITRIPLGIAIPHGLFGCFAEEARWSADALERRAKLADKIESRGNMWNEVKSDFSGLGLRFDDMEEYFGDFFS
jgi:carotenoid cleavage dioxygenase-like enzyme